MFFSKIKKFINQNNLYCEKEQMLPSCNFGCIGKYQNDYKVYLVYKSLDYL